jgi:hypothetical protein
VLQWKKKGERWNIGMTWDELFEREPELKGIVLLFLNFAKDRYDKPKVRDIKENLGITIEAQAYHAISNALEGDLIRTKFLPIHGGQSWEPLTNIPIQTNITQAGLRFLENYKGDK